MIPHLVGFKLPPLPGFLPSNACNKKPTPRLQPTSALEDWLDHKSSWDSYLRKKSDVIARSTGNHHFGGRIWTKTLKLVLKPTPPCSRNFCWWVFGENAGFLRGQAKKSKRLACINRPQNKLGFSWYPFFTAWDLFILEVVWSRESVDLERSFHAKLTISMAVIHTG